MIKETNYPAITFVYQHKKTNKFKCFYCDDAQKFEKSKEFKDYKLIETIDPCIWVENLLNKCKDAGIFDLKNN